MDATTGHPDFTIAVHQNKYVPRDSTEVHAIVRVEAQGEPLLGAGPPPGAAEVIIVDTSASMVGERLFAAKRAAKAAVDALREDVDFAVVSGSHVASMVYPRDPLLAPATGAHREHAKTAISKLSAAGGTRMGQWLELAGSLFAERHSGIRHAVLLTDGENEHETPEQLEAALTACAGRFVCDCRGVGGRWEPPELRRVTEALLGRFAMVANPQDLAADFEQMIEQAMGKSVADVALRIRTPHGAEVRFVKQTYPSLRDLTERRAEAIPHPDGPSAGDYPTGIWGAERRDYHVCLGLPAGEPGQNMLAAQVAMVLPGSDEVTLASGQILVEWTDDERQSTRLHEKVEHYSKQQYLTDRVQKGLAAYRAGDHDTAARELRQARGLAEETGNTEISVRLAEFFDPATGEIRPEEQVDEVAEKDLDTQSSEYVPPPREDEG